LLGYFVATVFLGAVLAPILFWGAQWLVGHGWFPFLAQFDFETFFHRALLLAALIFLWPLLRSIRVRTMSDLALQTNTHWSRDVVAGFLLSAIPLLCCGVAVIAVHVYSLRHAINGLALVQVVGSALVVPVIEETFFRGLVLGILLRSGRTYMSIFASSALYSIIHFLKAPDHTSTIVTWTSGFNSVANAFVQFTDPMLVAAAFTTLFLIGWILADARIRTRSLWLPIGLHSGWILTSGTFNKIAHREMLALPWLGKNLLVGFVPLGVGLITWLLVRIWLKYDRARKI
jgi:uncharacterized protein